MDKVSIAEIVRMFPARLSGELGAACADTAGITELRLRSGRPVCVCANGRAAFVTDGALAARPTERSLSAGAQEITDTLARLSEYSLYARQEEIKNGYLTIRGGHRVGIGSGYLSGERVDFGCINALNIRIAREVRGCADAVLRETQGEGPASVLIVSPPGCGKTTLLRDLVRSLASAPFFHNIALVDERRELAAVCAGTCTLDVGVTTDVLDGFPRNEGFDIAIRSLAPAFIACDELASESDAAAVALVARCGVRVLATAHADKTDDLFSERRFGRRMGRGIFQYVVLLGAEPVGSVKRIIRMVEK